MIECTCEESERGRLCPACTETYVKWNVEEVYGHRPVVKFAIGPVDAYEALGLRLAKGTN